MKETFCNIPGLPELPDEVPPEMAKFIGKFRGLVGELIGMVRLDDTVEAPDGKFEIISSEQACIQYQRFVYTSLVFAKLLSKMSMNAALIASNDPSLKNSTSAYLNLLDHDLYNKIVATVGDELKKLL